MVRRRLEHVNRPLTEEERARHTRIRRTVIQEIPPRARTERTLSPPGIPAQIRATREMRGLTWYAVARLAGIPNQATVRDIEQGKDVKLSNLQAVAKVLGLSVELIEQTC